MCQREVTCVFGKATTIEQKYSVVIKAHALEADLTLGVGSAKHQLCDFGQLI